MSLFGNLFGKSFDDYFKAGNELFEQKRYGNAKLSFEKALSKSRGAPEAEVEALTERIRDCKKRLAAEKIEDADRLAASGEIEEAVAHLEDAAEIFDDPDIHEAVRERLQQYEAEDTRQLVEEVDEIDDNELMSIIAGTWSDAQAEEYAAMPDSLRDAFLAGHDGRPGEAAEILAGIVSDNSLPHPPKYLHLELGRALLHSEAPEKAITSLDAFMKATTKDADAIEARVAACDMKAAALTMLGRVNDAERELKRACRIAPENHVVFLRLGVFERSLRKFRESVASLETARELMGQMQPDFEVIRELGYTYLAMGNKNEAKACFNAVLEHLASRGEHSQFDPKTAVTLATMHEEDGDPMAAADIYRHLSVGYDTQNHFIYNLEAARLLKRADGEDHLIRKYLTRARELAANDQQVKRLEEVARS